MFRRTSIWAPVFVLLLAVLFGCKGKEAPARTAGTQTSAGDSGFSLPLTETPVTLKMFIELDQGKIGVHYASYAEMLCFQEMAKRTNVTIEFIHPPAGLASEQLNLMLAAGDLPDLTYWNWNRVAGGPAKLLADNIILPLNEYIEKLPYLGKFLADNPAVDKEVKTDDGDYYCYPYIRKSDDFNAVYGYMIRKDWLDKLGLPVPETLDEWYSVLSAFRDKDPNGNGKKDESPLVSMYSKEFEGLWSDAVRFFYGAWGKYDSFYAVDGRVRMGAYEPEYKDYLRVMHKWIDEGLIDPNFVTLDYVQIDAAMLNNISGTLRSGLSDLEKYAKAFNSENVVSGVPFPVLVKGNPAYNFQASPSFDGSGAALNPKSKNNETTARWMDYVYSEEGSNLMNFGIEGQTYNWIDGYPQLVDSIYKNPKMTVSVALGRYAIGVSGFPFANDVRVRKQRMLSIKPQHEAIAYWNKSDISRILPVMTFTPEESQELANIMSEVNTFVKEYTLSFLLGKRDIGREFDSYMNTLKSMGIERAISINQAALERYNNR
jgi:putative aldouronate transport system substrate-binding protein